MTDQDLESNQEGRWSAQEHDRFEKAMSLYGKDWKKVVEFVRTRSILQVRSHAQKHFLKQKKRNTAQPCSEQLVSSTERISDKIKELEMDYFRKLNFLNYTYCLQLLSDSRTSKPYALPSIDLTNCEIGMFRDIEKPLPKISFPKVHEPEIVKRVCNAEKPYII